MLAGLNWAGARAMPKAVGFTDADLCRAAWQPQPSPAVRGVMSQYAATVSAAALGAVTC